MATHRPRKGQQSQWERFLTTASYWWPLEGSREWQQRARFRELGHISVCQERSPLSIRELAMWEPQLVISMGPWAIKTKKSIQNPDLKAIQEPGMGKEMRQDWLEKGNQKVRGGDQKSSIKSQGDKQRWNRSQMKERTTMVDKPKWVIWEDEGTVRKGCFSEATIPGRVCISKPSTAKGPVSDTAKQPSYSYSNSSLISQDSFFLVISRAK